MKACSGDAKGRAGQGREGAGGAFVLHVRGTAYRAARLHLHWAAAADPTPTINRKHYYYKHEEVECVTGRQPVGPSNISTHLISTRPTDSRQTHRRSANRSTHSLT